MARSTCPSQNAQSEPCSDHLGVASKFGWYGSARGDPDVSIGLDHLRFGMDRGYGSACGFRVWIRALLFDLQPFGRSEVVSCGRRRGLRTLSKVSKTRGL